MVRDLENFRPMDFCSTECTINETTDSSFKAMFSSTEIQFYRVLKMVYDILNYSYCGLLPSSSTRKSSLLQHMGPTENQKILLGPQTSKSHF